MVPGPTPVLPLTAERSPWLRGPMRLPGDPGLSQLALLLAAMGRGESVLENLSGSPAVSVTVEALRRLGVPIAETAGHWHLQGMGVGGLLGPDGPIDLTGAGDGDAPLVALLAAHDFAVRLVSYEPSAMGGALLDFLGANGIRVDAGEDGLLLRGARFPVPLDLALSREARGLVAPLLIHCLPIAGTSTLHLPSGVIEPAETLLRQFGAKLTSDTGTQGMTLRLEGMAPLRALAMTLPGDAALAAFPTVAALVAPNSEITLESVALSTTGLALLDALVLLGGDIALGEARRPGPGLADIAVRQGPLAGTTIPADLPIAPDDFPILAVAAAFAEGETLLEGLGEGARRLALTRALRANGVECVEQPTGLLIRGQRRVPGGGNVMTRLDPKLAMAFLVLGMAAESAVSIDDGGVMQALFPGFVPAFEHIGASFSGPAAQ